MVNVDGSLLKPTIVYTDETFSYYYETSNECIPGLWFDPIRPQDCIIADQTPALFSK
jgi:hypothetical protein